MKEQRSDPWIQDGAKKANPIPQASIYWVNQNTTCSLAGEPMKYPQESLFLLQGVQ